MVTIHTNDSGPTRADVVLSDRYASVSDCTGRLLVYDVENADAWMRSGAPVALSEWR